MTNEQEFMQKTPLLNLDLASILKIYSKSSSHVGDQVEGSTTTNKCLRSFSRNASALGCTNASEHTPRDQPGLSGVLQMHLAVLEYRRALWLLVAGLSGVLRA